MIIIRDSHEEKFFPANKCNYAVLITYEYFLLRNSLKFRESDKRSFLVTSFSDFTARSDHAVNTWTDKFHWMQMSTWSLTFCLEILLSTMWGLCVQHHVDYSPGFCFEGPVSTPGCLFGFLWPLTLKIARLLFKIRK